MVKADDRAAVTLGAAPPFEPRPPVATFRVPEARIDPDRDKGWIRRLAPILRPHRRVLVGSFVASAAMLSLQVAIPQVVRGAIDTSLIAKASPLGPYVIAILALGVGQALLGFVQNFGMRRASIEIEAHLRAAFFEHLGRMSFSFYDRVQGGQLISRGNSDIRMIQIFLAFGPMIAVSLLSFVAALVLMLQMNVLLTLVTAATLPFVYQIGMSMRKRLFPISWMLQARLADIATITEENVTGTRVVKSFAAEAHQISLFERATRKWRYVFYQQVGNQTRYAPALQNLPRLSMAALLLYGGYLVIHSEITLGTFVAFSSYLVMLQVPFMMLGMLMMMAQTAAASAQRVIQVLDEEPDIFDRPGAVDLEPCRGDVEFDAVHFSYDGAHEVLTGFGLRLSPGETVALVGRTGSGKSTVARLIPRFYDVKSGAVRIDGVDVRDLTLTSLRSHVGLVLDEPFLFSSSVRDNIAFGRPDASDEEIVAAATAAGADEFIAQLDAGYDTVVGERGYTLSGGQRQRIAIARTLVCNPKILVLDDATSSIDVQLEHEIHGALRSLMSGRTTLIIAHRLSTISLADRIVVLDGGQVVADGTHASLLGEVPLYRAILAHIEESEAEEAARAAARAEEERLAASTPRPFPRRPEPGMGGGIGGFGGAAPMPGGF